MANVEIRCELHNLIDRHRAFKSTWMNTFGMKLHASLLPMAGINVLGLNGEKQLH